MNTSDRKISVNFLGNIIKYLPLLSISLIFVSYIKLQLFFKNFGINIIEYMDTNEIILSFLPDIYSILVGLGAFSIFLVIFYPLNMGESREKKQNEYRRKSISYYIQLLKIRKMRRFGVAKTFLIIWKLISHPWIYSFILLILVSNFMWDSNLQDCATRTSDDPNVLIVSLWATYLIAVIGNKFKNYEIEPFNIAFFGIFYVFIMALIVIVNRRGKCRSEQIKQGISSPQIEFQYKKDTIISNDTLFYVGGTQQYIFLYNSTDEQTMVFPKTDLENVRIKKLKNN